jgi:hypothetical protein
MADFDAHFEFGLRSLIAGMQLTARPTGSRR